MLNQRGTPLKHSFTPDSLTPRTPKQLQQLLANAQRLGAGDVVLMVREEIAFRLYGDDLPKEIAARLEASLQDYERLKAAETGQRVYKASRVRLAIRKGGLKLTVESLVQKKDTQGFAALPFAQSFEAVILDYPDAFSHGRRRSGTGAAGAGGRGRRGGACGLTHLRAARTMRPASAGRSLGVGSPPGSGGPRLRQRGVFPVGRPTPI